jgi:predicted Zn-dependent peptidase
LAYEIRCDSLKFKDRPVVLVYMSFAKDKYRRAVSALEREISNVLKEGISAEELERVKVAFATSLERSNQTAVQRSNMLANAWLKGLEPDRWERLLKVASSATLGSVNRVLRQTLSTERVVKVKVGAVTAE